MMKQWIFSLLLLAIFTTTGMAYPFTEFKKEIRKEYPVTADAIVGVSNKYGKVEVHTWDKTVASFQIVITVDAANQSKADEIFETISIHFSHTSTEVRAMTEIENKPKSVWSWWWNSGESSEFKIDYVVYIPTRGKVDILNKYGDIYIDELANAAKIDLKYGNLRLEGSSDQVDCILGYSKARVGNTGGLTGDVKYSTVKVANTSNLACDSKYSKVEVTAANDMRINSRYDTYVIGKVNSIENEGKYDDFEIGEAGRVITKTAYTDWEIQQLLEMADVEMRYGEMKIFKVSPDCKKINFNGSYAHLKLFMDPEASYLFSSNSSYGDIKVPDGFQFTIDQKDGNSRTIKGHYRNPNAKMVLNTEISYGGVTIR